MNHQLDTIFTVTETAQYLKLSKSKVYAMAQRKEIPHLRMGRNVRFRLSDLMMWIENQVSCSNDEAQPTSIF